MNRNHHHRRRRNNNTTTQNRCVFNSAHPNCSQKHPLAQSTCVRVRVRARAHTHTRTRTRTQPQPQPQPQTRTRTTTTTTTTTNTHTHTHTHTPQRYMHTPSTITRTYLLREINGVLLEMLALWDVVWVNPRIRLPLWRPLLQSRCSAVNAAAKVQRGETAAATTQRQWCTQHVKTSHCCRRCSHAWTRQRHGKISRCQRWPRSSGQRSSPASCSLCDSGKAPQHAGCLCCTEVGD